MKYLKFKNFIFVIASLFVVTLLPLNYVPTSLANEITQEDASLTSDDFIVEYEGLTITLDSDPKTIIETLESNTSEGLTFIGWSDDYSSKFLGYNHMTDNSSLDLILNLDVVSGTLTIHQIDLSKIGTKQGISLDNSVSELIDTYGNPNEILSLSGTRTQYIYILDDVQLNFIIDTSTNSLTQIFISRPIF